MRHRQAAEHDLVAVDVDQNSAGRLLFAPGAGGVGGSQRGHVARPAVAHRDAVQMATVFRHKIGDEGRFPNRQETEIVGQLGQAGETRGRQPDFIAENRHVVRVQIACMIRRARQIESVVSPGLILGIIMGQERRVGEERQRRAAWPARVDPPRRSSPAVCRTAA